MLAASPDLPLATITADLLADGQVRASSKFSSLADRVIAACVRAQIPIPPELSGIPVEAAP